MSSAALLLGERVTALDAVAGSLIVVGVALGSIRRRTTVPAEGVSDFVRAR